MTAMPTTDLAPADQDAERAVLGSVFIRGHAKDVLGVLMPDDMSFPPHVEILESMLNVSAVGQPVDPVTVAADLRARSVMDRIEGRESYLMELMGAVPTAEGASHYARIVQDKARARKIIRACLAAVQVASTASPDDVLADLRVSLAGLGATSGGPVTLEAAMPAYLELLEERQRDPDGQVISTGIRALDGVLRGHRDGQAIVIAGRPGTGKSSHAFSTVYRAAQESGVRGLFFTLEMSRHELLDRAMALQTGIDGAVISAGRLDIDAWKKTDAGAKAMRKLPLSIDDRKLNIDQIVAEAHRWRAKNSGRALIAVDYLGLIRSSGRRQENRQVEVAGWMRELKILAGELVCPVIVVSQLNRKSADGDMPRKPVLTDLRESGAIEQDADVVVFTWQEAQTAELIVAKHRGGAIGVASVRWDGPRTAYFDDEGPGFAATTDANHWMDK